MRVSFSLVDLLQILGLVSMSVCEVWNQDLPSVFSSGLTVVAFVEGALGALAGLIGKLTLLSV